MTRRIIIIIKCIWLVVGRTDRWTLKRGVQRVKIISICTVVEQRWCGPGVRQDIHTYKTDGHLMPSRPHEATYDLAISEGKRGEYVLQLLGTGLAAQTLHSPVWVMAMATTFFCIARCPKILALLIAWQNHHDWYPFLSGRSEYVSRLLRNP